MLDDNDHLRAGTLPDDPEEGTEEMAPPAEVVEELRAERARLLGDAEKVRRRAESMGIDLDANADPFGDTWRTVAEWSEAAGAPWLDLDREPPPQAWLLQRDEIRDDGKPWRKGLFPLGKVGMLVAAGGVGKTMALCELALAVATDRPWLDALHVATPGRVLLAMGEEDSEEAHRRLWRSAKRLNLSPELCRQAEERIVLLPLAGNPNMALTQPESGGGKVDTPAAAALLKRVQDDGDGWSLIILDPASRFAGAEAEKDNGAATRFFQVLETLTNAPGNPSVLVAHHTSQDARKKASTDATSARGSTALSDAARWQAGLVNRPRYDDAPDLVDFAMQKNNYAAPWRGFAMLREPDGGALRKAREDDLKEYTAAKVVGDAKRKAQEKRESDAQAAGKDAAIKGKAAAEIEAAVEAVLKGGGMKKEPKKAATENYSDLPGCK